jgi:hypothetical protein
MKMPFYMIAVLLASALAISAQIPPPEQMKSDLIGHTMGGRQKSWKFQSTDQIKELHIKDKNEHTYQCTCMIDLELQAANAHARYAAEARVEYVKTPSGWKLDHVGLLSLRKIKGSP